MDLDESGFETLADTVLESLYDQLDEAVGDVADVDLEEGILKVSLDAGGEFIINKHAPNRQIWVSSPVSGALHFDRGPSGVGWIGTRGQEDLYEVLSNDISAKAGVEVTLEPEG
jgi:frataxin